MPALKDLITKGGENGQANVKAAKIIAKSHPLVAEVLGGSHGKTEGESVSASAITIFIHEGKARFSVNVKSLGTTLIGEIADLADPWGSIETALLTSSITQKAYVDRYGKTLTSEQEKHLL